MTSPKRVIRPWVRPFARLYFKLGHAAYRRRYGRLLLEEIDGVPLLVLPEVFNGVLMRTGAFLARSLPAPASASEVALDMGTGSGIGAIFAARRGYRVVGVDVNPEAVRCARINVLLNRVEERVEIRCGDLFAVVPGDKFDLVLFNPPFYRGKPRDRLDGAWRAPDVFERFAAGLPAALKRGARALVLLSTDGDGPGMLRALERNGFAIRPMAQRDLGNEVLTVYSASLA